MKPFLKKRGQAGFTLVELLVVVAIIAILAAVLLPQLMGYTTRARVSRAMSDLATMRTVIEAYCADEGQGQYPEADNDTGNAEGIASVLQGRGVSWTGAAGGVTDPWGSSYYYCVASDRLSFIVGSPGPDRTAGNGDDVYCTNTQSPVQGDSSGATPPYDSSSAVNSAS